MHTTNKTQVRSIFHEGVITHPYKKTSRNFIVYNNGNDTLDYELTQDIFTTVDLSSFSIMENYIWRAQRDKSIDSYYALTNYENKVTCSLHRHLIGLGMDNTEISVDHKDRNTLNNTLSNFRLATNLQQCFNQNKKKNKVSSPYWGVTKRNDCVKDSFRVRVQCIDGSQKNLGSFSCEIAAAKAWDDFMFEQYKNHNPLGNTEFNGIFGEPTINFISFNFPDCLGI